MADVVIVNDGERVELLMSPEEAHELYKWLVNTRTHTMPDAVYLQLVEMRNKIWEAVHNE